MPTQNNYSQNHEAVRYLIETISKNLNEVLLDLEEGTVDLDSYTSQEAYILAELLEKFEEKVNTKRIIYTLDDVYSKFFNTIRNL